MNIRLANFVTLAVIGAMNLIARADTATAAPATRPASLRPQNITGVENFAQVSERLYRGAQPTAEGFAELKKRGIRTVVNLRSFHSDRDELKGLGLRYLNIDCKAWHPENADVRKFLKLLEDKENWPVFVHCLQGADRTGYMNALNRIVNDGWTTADAVAEMNNFGFHPVWTEISEYLKEFDSAKIKAKLAKEKAPKAEVVK